LSVQVTICSGAAGRKRSDPLPFAPCAFTAPGESTPRTTFTRCPSWDAAEPALAALNNTAADPCGVGGEGGGGGAPHTVPRIAGTFYHPEYSYVTATALVNASLLATNASFAADFYKGSFQLYLQVRTCPRRPIFFSNVAHAGERA
jgi:hypothetical protein